MTSLSLMYRLDLVGRRRRRADALSGM
jgi:hypothetical protein